MKNKKGFTLIEVIISMVVIAIVMYAAIAIFITSGAKGANVEVFTVAQSLAEGKLEEAMAHEFADVSSEAEINFTGDLSNYSYEIISNYVSGEALDSAVGSATDYKKIQVLIRHSKLANPIQLESIRTNY
jgi:prepilin-type N-terminal cleavage/methylation domain-containing protein